MDAFDEKTVTESGLVLPFWVPPHLAGNKIVRVGVDKKFSSIQSAIDAAVEYNTIVIDAGVYYESLIINKPRIALMCIDGIAVIDAINQPLGSSPWRGTSAVLLDEGAQHGYYYGLHIKNASKHGMEMKGHASHNLVHHCYATDNVLVGFLISSTGNLFYQCGAHYNFDFFNTTPGKDADGFQVTGNYNKALGRTLYKAYSNKLYYCSAFHNADDNYDLWASKNTLIHGCVAGYAKSSEGCRERRPVAVKSMGDGSGFKLGGYSDSSGRGVFSNGSPTLEYCLAFNNPQAGFNTNNTSGAKISFSTAYGNDQEGQGRQFWMYDGTGTQANTINNCLATNAFISGSSIATHNSWQELNPPVVSNADFLNEGRIQGPYSRKKTARFVSLTMGHDVLSRRISIQEAMEMRIEP